MRGVGGELCLYKDKIRSGIHEGLGKRGKDRWSMWVQGACTIRSCHWWGHTEGSFGGQVTREGGGKVADGFRHLRPRGKRKPK